MRQTIFAVLLAVVLTAGGFFYAGWYHWEYLRPPTAEYHNQFTTMTGNNNTASPVLNPTPKEVTKQKSWLAGLVLGNKYQGILFGHMF